jgi:hypothetical protein
VLDEVEAKVQKAVALFRSRSPLEEATLTLDGTGPNGPLQMAVTEAIGRMELHRLRRINVLSGSTFSFLGTMAGLVKQHRMGLEKLITDGDRHSRRVQGAGMRRIMSYLLMRSWRRRPMFEAGTLSALLHGFVSPSFARTRVGDLPCNVSFWLYDLDARAPARVSRETDLGGATLTEIADCVGAVPRLYPPGKIAGRRFIDPVFSPAYRDLMLSLREEATNHLIANMVKDKVTDREIYVKPHAYGDGRKMIRNDFVRFALNLPNPRVTEAYRLAQRLTDPDNRVG